MDIHEARQRAGSNAPRVHGNGFVQLDLEPGTRLHIWGHPSLPRQRVDTGIHDHRFGFTSTVLVGRVVNASWVIQSVYDTRMGATHKVYAPRVRDGEDTVLSDTGQLVAAGITKSTTVLRGQSYHMRPAEFHETFTDRPTATLMTKDKSIHSHTPRVLVPVGQEPDNDFNRNEALPAARLWEIIEEVLRC